MSAGATDYTETEFLVDIMEDRTEDAAARIMSMYSNERAELLESFRAGVTLLEDRSIPSKESGT